MYVNDLQILRALMASWLTAYNFNREQNNRNILSNAEITRIHNNRITLQGGSVFYRADVAAKICFMDKFPNNLL